MSAVQENYYRSPFFYVGDKFKLLSQIVPHFPKKINRFIEPFCGGGSVFLNTKAEKFLLNDINSYMIQLHKFLISSSKIQDSFWEETEKLINKYHLTATYLEREVPCELRKLHPKTYFAKYNKEAYTTMRTDFNEDKNDMLRLYLLLIYGFNRMLRFNGKGNFNLPVGNVDFNKNVVNALDNYFKYVNNRDIHLYSMDFEDFINSTSPTKDDFVYLDPPYLITFSEYNKLWDEDSEVRLMDFLDTLNEKNIKFAVSNVLWHRKKYNGMFNHWAQKYNIVNIKSNYISFNDNSEKDSIEVLVKNY